VTRMCSWVTVSSINELQLAHRALEHAQQQKQQQQRQTVVSGDNAGTGDDAVSESKERFNQAMYTFLSEQHKPVLMAAETPAMLKLLLAAGADVRMTDAQRNTALHAAAAAGHPASVLCLLIKAGVDLHAVNEDDKTAAQVAAESGNTLAAALLNRAAIA
jgi:ankyrin repeat protein